MTRSIVLGMGQMKVKGGAKSENLARAREMIDEAAARQVDLVLLPEALDLGWTDPSAASEAEAIPEGLPFQRLSEGAREKGVFVCAGLTEKREGKIYNAAVLINREGELVGIHRKVNELGVGRQSYARGGGVSVFDTELGKIGLMICADAFATEQWLSRALGELGAEVILSPCAWAVLADHRNDLAPYGELWRRSYQPVAREFGLWIAGVSNVGLIEGGPWAGRMAIGASLVIDPDGEVVNRAPTGSRRRPCFGSRWISGRGPIPILSTRG